MQSLDSLELTDVPIESIPLALLFVNAQGQIVKHNQNLLGILELEQKEQLGANISHCFPKLQKERWDLVWQSLQVNPQNDFHCLARKQDGQLLSLFLHCRLHTDGEQNLVLIFLEDLSHKQNLQEKQQSEELLLKVNQQLRESHHQRLQNEKLSALGNLLTGITHELNNKITPILGYSELLQVKEQSEKKLKQLKIIEQTAQGAKSIIQSMLAFARPNSQQEFKQTDLKQSVQAVWKSMDSDLHRAGIQAKLKLPENPCLLHGNDKDLQLVVKNIMLNAIEALQDNEQDKLLELELEVKGQQVRMIISDNGHGMDSNTQKQVFDPFFTTRREDKSTGLGLSISYRVIQCHEGQIVVNSKPGQGTQFIISLPLLQ